MIFKKQFRHFEKRISIQSDRIDLLRHIINNIDNSIMNQETDTRNQKDMFFKQSERISALEGYTTDLIRRLVDLEKKLEKEI